MMWAGLAVLAGTAWGQEADQQGIVQREIAVLQFVGGGSPLTSAERQQAALLCASAMRKDAAKWTAADRAAEQMLTVLAGHDAAIVGRIWDQQRYAYLFHEGMNPVFAAEAAIEGRIIEAHDPVVVMDSAHHRAVTGHMLLAVREAANITAAGYKLPPPAGDFDVIVRGEVQSLPTLDPAIADGFAHATRDQPYLGRWLAAATPAARTKFYNNRDKVFHEVDNHRAEQWQIAEAGAMMSGFAAKHAPAGGSAQEQLYRMKMQNHVLGDAMRGNSPGCNPTLSASTRAENNCTSPIPVPGLP